MSFTSIILPYSIVSYTIFPNLNIQRIVIKEISKERATNRNYFNQCRTYCIEALFSRMLTPAHPSPYKHFMHALSPPSLPPSRNILVFSLMTNVAECLGTTQYTLCLPDSSDQLSLVLLFIHATEVAK